MLSENIKNYANKLWLKNKSGLGALGEAIQDKLNNLSEDMLILMELAYASLPVSDIGSVDFEVILAYAQHALMLRRQSPFCKDIPEDIFLHNVFYPRINSEDLVDCRGFFYDKLYEKIKNLSAYEAALEVNRWCAENMSYEMTDSRTINPLTAYSCTLGRCGEESTFAVTAIRSVGIPARQIYVPWWSHCDDNHAWVEVYTADGWHFLGACEPETELDRGWFIKASSRAMIVSCRNFFDYTAEGLKDEALIQRSGIFYGYNQSFRYAETVKTIIHVKNTDGSCAIGARLRFYVENMAGFGEIAELQSDETGRAEIESGRGSMLIQAELNNRFAWLKYKADENRDISITLSLDGPEEGESFWDFEAPKTGDKFKAFISEAEQKAKSKIVKAADDKRRARLNSYWKWEYSSADEKLQQILRTAAGNAEKLWGFYKKFGKEAEDILSNLSTKDPRDADTEILSSHIIKSRAFNNDENFLKYIQNPRIAYEKLTDWREAVENFLSAEQKKLFKEKPDELWSWINRSFKEGESRFHPALWLQPGAALRLGAADEKGRRLLFVAILRTLGTAARLNPVDNRAEFWNGIEFSSPEKSKNSGKCWILRLNVESSMKAQQDFGLSCWNGEWLNLELSEEDISALRLPQGIYCLHTVNRLPGGDQLISHRVFKLSSDMSLNVEKRKAEKSQLLSDFRVKLPVENKGLELQLYLEPGTEPTEHSLNELMENSEEIKKLMLKGLSLCLILPDEKGRENPTYKKTTAVLKKAREQILDFKDPGLEALSRSVYLEPGLFPLITLSDGETSYFAHAGYSVGTISLALSLSELIIK